MARRRPRRSCGPLFAEACRVQSAGEDSGLAGNTAAQRQRQDHEAGSEAAGRGLTSRSAVVTEGRQAGRREGEMPSSCPLPGLIAAEHALERVVLDELNEVVVSAPG